MPCPALLAALPFGLPPVVWTVVLVVVMLLGTALYALGAVWWERKVSAFIQDRLGPMEAGPHGLLQTLADILKMIFKEHVTPSVADVVLFKVAPVLVFMAVFAGFAIVPFAPGVVGAGLNIGLLYGIAVVSIEVVGMLMAGWGSNNKYALFGAVRAVSQIVSYEIPAGLALLAGVLMFGSLDLVYITQQQGILADDPVRLFGLWDVSAYGGVLGWGVFRYPHLFLAFLVYFTAGLAECNRGPFDIPEAESELIGGFHTEYPSAPFAFMMLAEYANMLLVSFLASVLFLGGWNSPLPNLAEVPALLAGRELSTWELLKGLQFATLTTGPVWGVVWLVGKGLLLVTVMMWVRWSLPRLRADQLMRVCWQYLTPLALVLVLVSALWRLAEVYGAL